MKKYLFILLAAALALSLVWGCQPKTTGEGVTEGGKTVEATGGESDKNDSGIEVTAVDLYFMDTGLRLPDIIKEACDINDEAEDGVWITVGEGGDMVCQIAYLSGEDIEARKSNGCEEGIYPNENIVAAKDDGYIVVMRPTCGTLNDESERETWNEAVQASKNIMAT